MFASVKPVTQLLRPSLICNLRRTPARNMPVCTVDTNLGRDAVPTDFAAKLSKVISQTLNKPEAAISIVVKTDVQMNRGGSEEPGAQVQIWSIGVFDEQRNPKYAKSFYEFLLPQLNLSHDRVTLLLHPLAKHDAAHLLYAEHLASTKSS